VGLDILDIIFRAEKAFGVKIHRGDIERLIGDRDPGEFTAGEFHDYLCQRCRDSGIPRASTSTRWTRCQLLHGTGIPLSRQRWQR
jgi:hypothetical protein